MYKQPIPRKRKRENDFSNSSESNVNRENKLSNNSQLDSTPLKRNRLESLNQANLSSKSDIKRKEKPSPVDLDDLLNTNLHCIDARSSDMHSNKAHENRGKHTILSEDLLLEITSSESNVNDICVEGKDSSATSTTSKPSINSSTLMAIKKLSHLDPLWKPSIVLSHLLYLFPNRSEIDKDLDNLRADGIILLIQLREWNVYGKDPTGIVLTTEWEEALQQQLKLYIEKKKEFQPASTRSGGNRDDKDFEKKYSNVLTKFIQFIKHETTENYILEEELRNNVGADEDDSIMLVRIGAMCHRDNESYYINCPHLGRFLMGLRSGRREMLLMVKNAPYKEIRRQKLLQRKLRKTDLKMELLIRDCVALNYVKEQDLPDGSELLTITREGLKYLEHSLV